MSIHNPTRKKKNLTPYIMALAVVLILIVAPLGSFFFLRSGIEYRIESLEQLEPKNIDSQLDGVIRLKAPFNGNARLIHIPGAEIERELMALNRLDGQIVDRQRFEIISLTNAPDDEDESGVKFVPSNHHVTFDQQFVLIDTSDVVRGVYAYREGIEKEIIRHLSVVIPVPKKKSIHLKRESN